MFLKVLSNFFFRGKEVSVKLTILHNTAVQNRFSPIVGKKKGRGEKTSPHLITGVRNCGRRKDEVCLYSVIRIRMQDTKPPSASDKYLSAGVRTERQRIRVGSRVPLEA